MVASTHHAIRDLVPQRDEEDLRRLVPACLEIWNAPENLPYLSLTLRPFEEDQVRVRMEHHRRADAADIVCLQRRL